VVKNENARTSHKHEALVLIDFVNLLNFDGAVKLEPQAVRAARHAAALKRGLKRFRVPTIYANDNFGNWRSDFRQLVDTCAQTRGRRLVSLLEPEPDDLFVFKPPHSCFYQTPLMLLLQSLRVSRLILTGLTADICVLFSAYDALCAGSSFGFPRTAPLPRIPVISVRRCAIWLVFSRPT